MQVCCPVCDTPFPIAAGFSEADGKRLAALLAEFEPTLGRAAIAYLALFKPAKTALRLARAARLVAELKTLVDPGTVCKDERAGLRRSAPPQLWASGIEQMLAQRSALSLPLDSHNYLRAVVFGLADKADAQAEREREEALRQGRRSTAPTPATDAAFEKLQRTLEQVDHDLRMGFIEPAEAELRRTAASETYRSTR